MHMADIPTGGLEAIGDYKRDFTEPVSLAVLEYPPEACYFYWSAYGVCIY